MGIRQTRFQIKNNTVPNAPFSGATLLVGEPIVNTADGILMFSGKTSSTTEWTPAGSGANSNFFEVGSNLYQLKIRDKITSYGGVSNLTGKFLSGTTNGFVAADITTIQGVDTYVTGFTYDNNVLRIKQNQGQSDLTATINTMSGLTVNGTLSATTINVSTLNTTSGSITTTPTNPNDIVNYSTLTSFTQNTDVYVTGNTLTAASNDTATQSATLSYRGTPIGGPYFIVTQNTFTTGGTYNSGTTSIDFDKNDGTTFSVDLSNIDVNDTFVISGTYVDSTDTLSLLRNDGNFVNVTGITDTFTTGFTYNPTTNTFTIKQNQGQSDLPVQFTTVSGLTLSNLTAGRVVYVGTGGLLTDEAGFTYDDGTNTFSVPSDGTVNVGTGGLSVAGDAVIQGSLTVFGPSISAFTSQLYVEDDNITLNYNPTGNTTSTSVGAGWTIQDGSGIANTATTLNIGVSYNNSNLSPNTEYTSSVGNSNRNLFTQVGDIIIRNTNYDKNSPDGNRVLAEGDILDGGTY